MNCYLLSHTDHTPLFECILFYTEMNWEQIKNNADIMNVLNLANNNRLYQELKNDTNCDDDLFKMGIFSFLIFMLIYINMTGCALWSDMYNVTSDIDVINSNHQNTYNYFGDISDVD